MKHNKETTKEFSRRDFIKTTAVGVGTAALAGFNSKEAKAITLDQVPRWDQEADVVVVGFGLAGASTAIHAYDAGAKVIVLEKLPQDREGGNSKVSANLLFVPGDYDDAIAYFEGMCAGHMDDMPDELVQTWAREMMANRAYLEGLGISLTAFPGSMSPELPFLPGSETMTIYIVNSTVGNGALWKPIRAQVAARPIEVLYETPATKLVATCDGEVRGVIAQHAGREIAIKANKGVVLTCGSFEFNEAMKANYLAAPIYSAGTPGNTGDGIRMAQALGADLWHMNNAMGPILPGFFTNDLGPEWANIPIWISISRKGYIYVDQSGSRFMNEDRPSEHGHGWNAINYFDGQKYPRIPWWIVFDEANRKAGPLTFSFPMSWYGWYCSYEWSADNSAEIANGWIQKGNTVEELAAAIEVDPATLAQTVSKYNNAAAAGIDSEFGRPSPIALQAPFYAIQTYPTMVNTQGGPKRNHKAQVLHVEGSPIPRLYSAGECGSVYAWLYQGGGNLGECLAFGRIAGRNAAAETPWS